MFLNSIKAYCSIVNGEPEGYYADYKQEVAQRIHSEDKIKDKGLLGDSNRINSSTS